MPIGFSAFGLNRPYRFKSLPRSHALAFSFNNDSVVLICSFALGHVRGGKSVRGGKAQSSSPFSSPSLSNLSNEEPYQSGLSLCFFGGLFFSISSSSATSFSSIAKRLFSVVRSNFSGGYFASFSAP